jgi:hypothetical protein
VKCRHALELVAALNTRGCASLLVGIVLLSVIGGCSTDITPSKNTKGLENLQPASGSVSYQGKPTPGAIVLFCPEGAVSSGAPRIAGEVEDDGTFEMKTTVSAGTRFGVAPGKYIVTISWNKKVDEADRDSDDGPDLVPSKYKDPATSNLIVEIEEGDNELEPFVLTD